MQSQNNILKIGKNIPNFTLTDIFGKVFSVSEMIGDYSLVIHFSNNLESYQTQATREDYKHFLNQLEGLGARVIAISSLFGQNNLIDKFSLSRVNQYVPLHIDENNELTLHFGIKFDQDFQNITILCDKFGEIFEIIDHKDSIPEIFDLVITALDR